MTRPRSRHSSAAVRPAIPDPMTTTSTSRTQPGGSARNRPGTCPEQRWQLGEDDVIGRGHRRHLAQIAPGRPECTGRRGAAPSARSARLHRAPGRTRASRAAGCRAGSVRRACGPLRSWAGPARRGYVVAGRSAPGRPRWGGCRRSRCPRLSAARPRLARLIHPDAAGHGVHLGALGSSSASPRPSSAAARPRATRTVSCNDVITSCRRLISAVERGPVPLQRGHLAAQLGDDGLLAGDLGHGRDVALGDDLQHARSCGPARSAGSLRGPGCWPASPPRVGAGRLAPRARPAGSRSTAAATATTTPSRTTQTGPKAAATEMHRADDQHDRGGPAQRRGRQRSREAVRSSAGEVTRSRYARGRPPARDLALGAVHGVEVVVLVVAPRHPAGPLQQQPGDHHCQPGRPRRCRPGSPVPAAHRPPSGSRTATRRRSSRRPPSLRPGHTPCPARGRPPRVAAPPVPGGPGSAARCRRPARRPGRRSPARRRARSRAPAAAPTPSALAATRPTSPPSPRPPRRSTRARRGVGRTEPPVGGVAKLFLCSVQSCPLSRLR